MPDISPEQEGELDSKTISKYNMFINIAKMFLKVGNVSASIFPLHRLFLAWRCHYQANREDVSAKETEARYSAYWSQHLKGSLPKCQSWWIFLLLLL